MPLPDLNETVDAAARTLFAKHAPANMNRYGACEDAGYQAREGRDDKVRVSHVIPNQDLLDDDRMTDDEQAAERHRMVDAYAATLEAAGWTVDRRGPRSRKPYLLASH
ncbi:hypothetical protein [Streptomyces kaempferi]|uniref:Uncharacterized protein n=1 Tax=Streptomyces kaempferi TaxID=333725 RepID=A0ABW3XHJ9_9ACTN